MYNDYLKSRFLEETEFTDAQRDFAKWLFQKSSKYEEDVKTDISQMNYEELIFVLRGFSCLRNHSNLYIIRTLKQYVAWCEANNVPGTKKCIYDITTKSMGVSSLKSKTVASPAHLQRCLDIIFRPESDKSVDNTFRCACWLLYGGVLPEDLESITVNDVSLTHMIVKYKGYEVPIYREGIQSYLNCFSLREFAYMHPGYPKGFTKPRAQSIQLLRGQKEFLFRNFQNKLSKYQAAVPNNASGVHLTAVGIWFSGLFYTTYENERIGIPPDFRHAAILSYKAKEDMSQKQLNKALKDKRAGFSGDYQRWKEAYT